MTLIITYRFNNSMESWEKLSYKGFYIKILKYLKRTNISINFFQLALVYKKLGKIKVLFNFKSYNKMDFHDINNSSKLLRKRFQWSILLYKDTREGFQ